MGILDSLFGGGGGDIPPTSKLRNMDITPDEWKALRGPLASIVGGATTGKRQLNIGGIPQAPGPYAAPVTGNEQSILNMLMGNLNPSAGAQAASGLTSETLGGKYLTPESNPFLQSTIESAVAPLRNEWQNTILPNLKIGFTQAGQNITGFGSSPFDRAAALASNEYMRKVGDIGTQLAGQNYQQERTRQQEAVNQQGTMDAQRLQQLTQTLQSVALPRLVEQYGIDQGTQEFRNRLNTLMQLLNMQAGLAQGSTVNVQPSSSTQGMLGQLLGGAGGLAKGISGFI